MTRRSILPAATLAILATAAGPVAARSGQARPSAASARVKQPSTLWATVNICDTHRHPRTIGIRGQMPALSSGASMVMIIRVEYWASGSGQFELVPGVARRIRLGNASWGLHQGGANFPFRAPAALLRGIVRFEWTRSGKIVRRATRATTRGHHGADFGDPRGYSAATCRIG